MSRGLKGVLGGIGSFAARSPMLAQGALGLLAGDKPANVLRKHGLRNSLRRYFNLGQPGGFMGGARQSLGMQPTSIAPASVQPKVNQGYISEGADFSQINNPKTIVEQAAKEGPSFLEKLGLVNSEGKDFFEKYGSLVKLGTVGASIAAAALGEDHDGQSDDIPAMLSDGEFVMTKQAVMAAGNGNRNEGTKKMYDMMYSLEDKARNMGIGRV